MANLQHFCQEAEKDPEMSASIKFLTNLFSAICMNRIINAHKRNKKLIIQDYSRISLKCFRILTENIPFNRCFQGNRDNSR